MPTGEYAARTQKNIPDSDGTLIISHGRLTGGSALTEFLAEKHKKPCIHIDLNKLALRDTLSLVSKWMQSNGIKVLNVAGPRAGKDPMIYQAVMEFLEEMRKLQATLPKSEDHKA